MPDEKIVIINQSRIKIDEGRYFSSVLRKKWDDVLTICRHNEVCSFALLTREHVKLTATTIKSDRLVDFHPRVF